jgi:hypothetical protein
MPCNITNFLIDFEMPLSKSVVFAISMLTGLFASLFVAARVNTFVVCVFHLRILFLLLPITVISTMLNYVRLEVLVGISLSRSATGHKLSAWIYCPRTHLNKDVVMRIGLPSEMVKEI